MREVGAYAGTVRAEAGGVVCDFSSVMSLMALGLLPGSTVTIRVEGPGEDAFCDRVVELFETRFDFPPGDG